jgi:hypothetical protein
VRAQRASSRGAIPIPYASMVHLTDSMLMGLIMNPAEERIGVGDTGLERQLSFFTELLLLLAKRLMTRPMIPARTL